MSTFKRYKGKKISSKHPKYREARWWMYKRIGGKVIHKAIPEAQSKEQADQIERRILERLGNSKYGLPDTHLTFSKFADSIYSDYIHSHNTNTYVQELFVKEFKKHFGSMLLAEITESNCLRFRAERLKTPLRYGGKRTNAAVNREMATVSKIFTLAIRNRLIFEHPMKFIEKLKASEPRKRSLSPAQLQALWDALESDQLMKRIFILAINLPLRRGQILAIEPEDIHGDWLRAKKSKGNGERDVPLNAAAKEALADLHRDGQLPLPIHRFEKRWRAALETAGINKKGGTRKENFHLHDCRHLLGSSLMKQGVNPYHIQELFDHSDFTTSAIYVTAEKAQLADAMNRVEIQEIDGIN